MSVKEKKGVCPNCEESDLEYGDIQTSVDDSVYYPVTCNACLWEGNEWYKLKFYGFNI